jgi:hypothetical protein
LSILNDYLEFSPITSEIGGMSFDHHRVKIITVSSLLNLFEDFIGNIKYKNQNSKSQVGELINRFFFRDIIKDAVNSYMNPEQD